MLELNRRVVFRRFGRGAVLYDPDRRRSLTLNSAGAELYSRLRRSGVPGAEEAELLAGFSDRRREHAERFLAMLQNAGMLAGHAGSAAAPPPEPAGEPEAAAPAGRLGIGNSMRGTFSSGDELRVEEIAATELRPGDVVNIPANVKHWHGAACDSWFQHLAIEVPGKDGKAEWCEPVTDEQYQLLS